MKYFLFIILGLCNTGWAQLRWDNRNLEIHPTITDTKIVAVFPFINAGKRPVKIKEVRTSCGCTTASMDKEIYTPGERGKITATLEIESRTGVQEKEIYVSTDDSGNSEQVLSFKATIPEVLKVEPIFLNWLKGEALTPKTVEVKVMNNFPVHHLDVTSTNPNMVAEVKQVAGSRDFKIIVTPKKVNGGINAGLEIAPDFPKNPPKFFHVYTHVDA
ncbi:MAG: DUF1573 domain-containing protein [Chthoniobacteraceae bacterium]